MKSTAADLFKRYLSKLKKYVFVYKDGFFEFPYIAYSPHDMIEGLKNTLFVKHHPDKSKMVMSTPFMVGSIFYQQLDVGLWMTLADVEFKVNINNKPIIDKNAPSEYFILSLVVSKGKIKRKSLIDGFIVANASWMFFKPDVNNDNCNYAGVNKQALVIYFSKAYLERLLTNDERIANSFFKAFYQSEHGSIFCPEKEDVANRLLQPLVELFERRKAGAQVDIAQLTQIASDLFHQFIATSEMQDGGHVMGLPDSTQKKMLKAEKILMGQVGKPFGGVKPLATKVGISLTSLKTNFKLMFGQTIYQYFRTRQLLFAKQLLLEKRYSVTQISTMLGYQNPSKFSAAFKNQFGVLPSEIGTNDIP